MSWNCRAPREQVTSWEDPGQSLSADLGRTGLGTSGPWGAFVLQIISFFHVCFLAFTGSSLFELVATFATLTLGDMTKKFEFIAPLENQNV